MRGTYSKYFQNNISETDISSAAQLSTTWCSFPETLYTFNICNVSLRLKGTSMRYYQKELVISFKACMCWQIHFYNVWILEKNNFCSLLKVNFLFSYSVNNFSYLWVNLLWSWYFGPFSIQIYRCILFDRLIWLKIWNCLEYLLYYSFFPLCFGIWPIKSIISFSLPGISWLYLLETFFTNIFVRILY